MKDVIILPCRAFTVADVTELAVLTPTGETRGASSRARRNSRRYEGAEAICNQPVKRWVGVHRLEVTHHVVAHITNFQDHLAGQLALHAERPFLRHRLMEVWGHTSIISETWINASRNIAQLSGSY